MQNLHVHLSHQFPFNSALKRRPLTRVAAWFVHFLHTYIYLFRKSIYIYPGFFLYIHAFP